MEDGLEVQPLHRVSLDTASWAVTRGEGTGKAQYRSSVVQASVQCSTVQVDYRPQDSINLNRVQTLVQQQLQYSADLSTVGISVQDLSIVHHTPV